MDKVESNEIKLKKIDSRLDGIVASTSNWTLYIVIGIEVVLGIFIIAI